MPPAYSVPERSDILDFHCGFQARAGRRPRKSGCCSGLDVTVAHAIRPPLQERGVVSRLRQRRDGRDAGVDIEECGGPLRRCAQKKALRENLALFSFGAVQRSRQRTASRRSRQDRPGPSHRTALVRCPPRLSTRSPTSGPDFVIPQTIWVPRPSAEMGLSGEAGRQTAFSSTRRRYFAATLVPRNG